MSRGLFGRGVIASVVLLIVTSSIASAGAATPTGGTPATARSQAVSALSSALVSTHSPTGHGANASSIQHGRMSKASDVPSRGAPPRMVAPFGTAASTSAAKPRTALVTPPAPVQATLTAQPNIGQPGFDGLSRSSGPDTNTEPAGPWVAVGPDSVMQATNRSFRTTDRQGTELGSTSVAGFIGSFSSFSLGAVSWFDPHVIYDSLHNRFFMEVDGYDCVTDANASWGHGYTFFATSDTIDPLGSWTGAYFVWADTFVDNSAPGTSSDKFAFASNLYDMAASASCSNPTAYVGGAVQFIDWADWLGPDSSFADGIRFLSASTFGARVAVQAPASSGRLFVVMGYDDGDGHPNVTFMSITGPSATNGTVERISDLTAAGIITDFSSPPAPNQPGPDTIDGSADWRPTDAIWQNNRLTFVSTRPCTPTGDSVERDCVRVGQLDTTAVNSVTDPTLRQDFLIAENGEDSYVGGIGMSGDGRLQVVWTRSSATAGDYPSTYATYQLRSDAIDTVAPFELLKAGTGTYTNERWGDYVGVAQDPIVPSAVWQADEYAGGGTEWKTFVSRLQPVGSTYYPITPVRVLDTRSGKGLSGPFTAGAPRTWQVGGTSGIPANAVAVTGNVTVTGQTAAGYVAVTPTPVNPPPSSTINFPTGDNRANNLIVALSSTGSLSAVYRAGGGQKTQLIFDVTGYFLANDGGATFKTVTPARVLDTRSNVGLAGKFVNGTARQLQVTGTGGVPTGATAITGNLTVTQQSAGGFLSLSPAMPPTNPTTSNLNFPVSDNRANGLFAPLDGSGALWIVYKSGVAGATTHVLLDVTGYFVPDLTGLRFVPLNPARVMDTRSGTVLSQLHNPFVAGTPRVLPVDGHWGVPVSTTAISGNLTVTGQTGSGFVSMSPDVPPPVPATSSVNFPLGDNRANGVVAPLNGSGDTYLVYIGATGKHTDLILDLSGYFE